MQLRRLAKLGTGHTPSRQHPEYWENCTIPWLTLADVWQLRDGATQAVTQTSETISELGLANSAAVLHPAGTVALSRTASVGFCCILGRDMATSQDFATWTCGPRLLPRYLLWALRGTIHEIVAATMGSTHQTIYMPDIQQIAIRLPPVEVQAQIADFLDAETTRIDALIEKKRRMIALVAARWQASVRERLSSLHPPTPLKRRWCVIDCKHRTPVYVDDGYPVVSPGELSPGRIDLSISQRFVGPVDFADLTDGRRPRRGDVIYSRNASAGVAAYVATDEPFCMGQDVCLITSGSQDQRFLMYALNSLAADQLEPLKIGTTITRINVDQIGELRLPAPPVEIQREIADELDATRARIDLLKDRLERQIGLLREHRQALITAAVTGQLDVGGDYAVAASK